MKCTLLDTESTTVITISNFNDFRSSTIKFTLMVLYLVFGIASMVSSLSGN